jgi:hypothetical protein
MVVATPYGSNPSIVTGYAVGASTGGLNIYFKVSQPASVTFNYMVQG